MAIKNRLYVAAALVSFLALDPLHSVQAGQLFPPTGLTDSTKDCPNGEVLTWKGDGTVQCVGVTVASCPVGQVLTGVDQGAPKCVPNAGALQWVAVEDCANPSSPAAWGSYGVQNLGDLTWCTSSKSPEQVCQKAGYNNFVGACKATGFDGATPTQGVLTSYTDTTGKFIYRTPAGGWSLDCLAGSQGSQASGVNLTILCSY